MAKQTAEYEQGKNKLSELLKNKKQETPIQEVRPVEVAGAPAKEKRGDPREGESHVNFWTETPLFDRLRLHSFMTRKTIRQIATEALDLYLKHYGR